MRIGCLITSGNQAKTIHSEGFCLQTSALKLHQSVSPASPPVLHGEITAHSSRNYGSQREMQKVGKPTLSCLRGEKVPEKAERGLFLVEVFFNIIITIIILFPLYIFLLQNTLMSTFLLSYFCT